MNTMSQKRQATIEIAFKTVRVCNITPSTITDLAKYMGISRNEVKIVVEDLVELGVLKVRGKVHGRGRPTNLYEYKRSYKW